MGMAACAAGLLATDQARLRVLGETIIVVAPEGLCIDPSSVDVGRAGGVAIIGDCAVVGDAEVSARILNAVLTVNVTTGGLPGTLADLETFLIGPGLVTLGRSGDPEAVTVQARQITEEALYIKVQDTGPQPLPGGDDEFWRVFFPAGERLLIGSITPFVDSALSDDAARAILADLVVRTQAANAPPAPVEPAPVEVAAN